MMETNNRRITRAQAAAAAVTALPVDTELSTETALPADMELSTGNDRVDAVLNRLSSQIEALCRQYSVNTQLEIQNLRESLDVLNNRIDGALTQKSVQPTNSIVTAVKGLKAKDYDGTTVWEDYHAQFSLIADSNGWSDEHKACHLASSLVGPALSVLASLTEAQRRDYGQLVENLRLRFGTTRTEKLYYAQFHARKQNPGEDFASLGNDIRRLTHLTFAECNADTQERIAAQQFLQAISDSDIRSKLVFDGPTTVKTAVEKAFELQALKLAIPGTSQTNEDACRMTQAYPIEEIVNRVAAKVKEELQGAPVRRPIRCWNCGQLGHTQNRCYTERRSYNYSNNQPPQQGNLTRPQLMGQSSVEDTFVPVMVNSLHGGDNGLIIKGKIDGVDCNLLIDTGSNVTLVNPKILAASGRHTVPTGSPSRIVLRTVTGQTAPVIEQRDVTVQLSNNSYVHRVLVAEIEDDVILGLDFLRSNNCIVDVVHKTLTLNNFEFILSSRSHPVKETKSLRILCTQDVKIEPMTETIVPGVVENHDEASYMMIIPRSCALSPGLFCAAALVDTTMSKVPVRMLNVTEGCKVIKKGEIISDCERQISSLKTESKYESGIELPEHLIDLFERSSTELNDREKLCLKSLLIKHGDVFSKNKLDNGRCTLVKHSINVGNADPIKQQPRRLPVSRKHEVEELVESMQKQGVVEPSSSPWASPIVLVTKKDGSTRFCIDYRKLNDITKKDSYPLPRIDDTLDAVAGSLWYTTLDLQSGYWQVELDPADKEKTAFTTPAGLWQFTVMPFGLSNAPATFERLMELVLKGLPWNVCLVYLDDILVHSRSFQQHINNLDEIFKRLSMAGLKLNAKKCNIFRQQVLYLGHVISNRGIHTDPRKTEAISKWPVPNDVRELRSFLGLCSYYRRFIKSFSSIAKPLFTLTENKKPFIWSSDAQAAFDELKLRMTNPPVLAHPNQLGEFILDTDASQNGIGAVLSQIQDGQERVIAFFSKIMSKPERNYCVTRRELLAVVKACQHFHIYLYGRKFTLRTDHAALKWLLSFKEPEGQLARWIECLQQYNFTTVHRSGKIHKNADALSRRPCIEKLCKYCARKDNKQENVCLTSITALTNNGNENFAEDDQNIQYTWEIQNLRTEQRNDPDLSVIIQWLENNRRPEWHEISALNTTIKGYWALWATLGLKRDILHRRYEKSDGTVIWQTVVPKNLRNDVLQEYHNNQAGGHYGITRTHEKIRRSFYWLGCRIDVERWCKNCDTCAARKGPKVRTKGPLQLYNVGAPFERIAVDILGPLPNTPRKNRYLLVIMDYFTKWPEAVAIPNQEAETVADVILHEVVSRHGVPFEIHSDQGRNFESHIFHHLMQKLGSRKTRTTPMHPQSDGMVERCNRTILQYLSMFVSRNQRDWDVLVPLFLLSYRSAQHETTQETPSMMLYGRELRLPLDLIRPLPPETEQVEDDLGSQYLSKLQDQLRRVHEFARRHIEINSDRLKTRYDTKSTRIQFVVGDHVWLHNPRRSVGVCSKLLSAWEGPFVVLEQLNDVVYKIRKSPHSKPVIVHVNRLAPYTGSASRVWRNSQRSDTAVQGRTDLGGE